MRSIYSVLGSTALISLLTACAGLPTSDMEADWESSGVSEYGTVHVMHDGDRVVLGTETQVLLLDGETGQRVGSVQDTVWENLARSIDMTSGDFGLRSEEADGWEYTVAPLESPDVVMLFDFRFADELVMAMDATSGDILWDSNEFDYSLGQFSLGEAISQEIGRAMAGAFGMNIESERATPEQARETQLAYMSILTHELPDRDEVLFQTVDGLVLLNARDGEVVARVESFSGPGVVDAEVLPDGDLMVLSGGRNHLDASMDDGYHLARLSPTGELRWQAEHEGEGTIALHVTDEAVIVEGMALEAFALDSGEPLWDQAVNAQSEYHHLMVDGDTLYLATEPGDGRRSADSQVFKKDARTGDVVWERDASRTDYHGLQLADGVIIVHGEGQAFGRGAGVLAIDADNGDALWDRTGLASPGMFSGPGAVAVTTPVIAGDHVYFADDDTLYVTELHSGATRHELDHDDANTRNALAVALHDDQAIVMGTGAVAGFDRNSGERNWQTEVEAPEQAMVRGQGAVVYRGNEYAQVVDMSQGGLSGAIRQPSNRRIFGDLDGQVFVDSEARFVISVRGNGRVVRHSF